MASDRGVAADGPGEVEHPPAAPRERIPALDGLRGLAVAGVLAFHTGAGWAQGGFLGVSAFFTLSGFLICSLLLDEFGRHGSVSLRAFWARRARRLLPASLVALLGVLAYGSFLLGSRADLDSLRVDVLSALGYVANWRFVASSRSYADLFRAPSAAQHFWSLAIEEQFYVVFPVVVVAAQRVGRLVRRVRLVVGVVLAAAFALSIAAGAAVAPAAGADPSRAYYGTDVRAAELLVGAGLAVALAGGRSPIRGVAGRAAAAVSPVVLAAVLWSWHVVDRSDGLLYDGGLVVHALAVAVLIVAAHGASSTATLLSLRPLRWLGRVSYGAYLYHWPIFLWLDPSGSSLPRWAVEALRFGLTLGLAAASARWLEEPIRTGRRLRAARPAGLALAGAGAVAVAVVAVLGIGGASSHAPATGIAAPLSPPPPPPPRASIDTLPVSVTATTEPTRVYVVGDSVALRLGLHLQTWGIADGRLQVWAGGWLACAAARGGTYRYAGVAKPMDERCDQWATIRARELDEIRPDVVLVSFGVFDVLDRRLPGERTWQHLGQPAYDGHVRRELAALQDLLQSRGASVVWLTSPYVQTGGDETGRRPSTPFPEWDHARMDRFNALVREVAATSADASVLDLQQHLRDAWGDEEDPEHRPDGVHPSIPAADALAAWIGPQLAAAATAPQR